MLEAIAIVVEDDVGGLSLEARMASVEYGWRAEGIASGASREVLNWYKHTLVDAVAFPETVSSCVTHGREMMRQYLQRIARVGSLPPPTIVWD